MTTYDYDIYSRLEMESRPVGEGATLFASSHELVALTVTPTVANPLGLRYLGRTVLGDERQRGIREPTTRRRWQHDPNDRPQRRIIDYTFNPQSLDAAWFALAAADVVATAQTLKRERFQRKCNESGQEIYHRERSA
ncbi:MAG: hypothetical protein KF851_07335 [Pirellulaceae bacterium]|nr:hypothetical protein [Pirellulaceae bacterium]